MNSKNLESFAQINV